MKIVWTNGCFDVLHRGHLEMLKYAKAQGDYLVVGIDADSKVKQDKGPSRPINSAVDRKFVLECVACVDTVVVFNSAENLKNTIKGISPAVMVIGSDWKGKTVIGQEYCKELKFFDRIGDYSTTKIIEGDK